MAPEHSKIIHNIYNAVIAILALASIAMTALDLLGIADLSMQPFRSIDTVILLIFAIDYAVRFYRSRERKRFFKENIFDLLAIIPFSSLFSMFRVFRIFRIIKAAKIFKFMRLLRAGAFLAVLKKRTQGILKTNGFVYVLYGNLALILGSSVIMMHAESMTFPDALWWSIVTCATVGYGDISPSTAVGRIVAVILMVFGIGLLGMLTGSITTYFAQRPKANEIRKNDELQEILENASDDERRKILEIAKIIVRKD